MAKGNGSTKYQGANASGVARSVQTNPAAQYLTFSNVQSVLTDASYPYPVLSEMGVRKFFRNLFPDNKVEQLNEKHPQEGVYEKEIKVNGVGTFHYKASDTPGERGHSLTYTLENKETGTLSKSDTTSMIWDIGEDAIIKLRNKLSK